MVYAPSPCCVFLPTSGWWHDCLSSVLFWRGTLGGRKSRGEEWDASMLSRLRGWINNCLQMVNFAGDGSEQTAQPFR